MDSRLRSALRSRASDRRHRAFGRSWCGRCGPSRSEDTSSSTLLRCTLRPRTDLDGHTLIGPLKESHTCLIGTKGWRWTRRAPLRNIDVILAAAADRIRTCDYCGRLQSPNASVVCLVGEPAHFRSAKKSGERRDSDHRATGTVEAEYPWSRSPPPPSGGSYIKSPRPASLSRAAVPQDCEQVGGGRKL